MSSSNDSNINNAQQQPFIRGIGAAIPGMGDERIAGGKGGALVHVSDNLEVLCKNYALHNPKTGKVIDRNWARRNLGVETIAVANVDDLRRVYEGIGKEWTIPNDAVSVTEDELAFTAFDEALERAKLIPKDIDVILRVSVTQDDVYFWENMRVWKRQYPDLRNDVQMQYHPIGCPAFLFELKLAKQLLCSPDIKNVAIVISNACSVVSDQEMFELHGHENSLMHWTNLVLFGDGASTVILSTDCKNPMPAQVYDLTAIEYRIDNETWVSKRDEHAIALKDGSGVETRSKYSLNVEGTKLIRGAMGHWRSVLKKNYGFTLDQAKHVAFHAANPKVLKSLGEYLSITEKLSFLSDSIGNLGPVSTVVNLHDRLYKSGTVTNHGDVIYGFSIGAMLGVLDGVYLLTARDTNKANTMSTSQVVPRYNLSIDMYEYIATVGWTVSLIWKFISNVLKTSILAQSPAKTKVLRRFSRRTSSAL